MRKPIRKNRKMSRLAKGNRWWLVAAVVAIFGIGFLLRHQLPTLLSFLDGGPDRIQATSLERRIQQAARSPDHRANEHKEDATKFRATASFPKLDVTEAEARHITVAGWSFSGPDLKANAEPEKAWRTSFGAERVARDPRHTTTGFVADIIAVLGIDTFDTLRKAVPARDYFLVMPPQLRNMALAQARTHQPFPIPSVAIAIRRDAGLRLVRRAQMVFGDPSSGSEIDAALRRTPADLQAAAEPRTLPFAVEIIAGGSRLWVIVAAFETEMNARLAGWIARRRADGQAVIVIGLGDAGGIAPRDHRADLRFGRPGGRRVPGRDSGCTVPDVSMHVWRSPSDQKLLQRFDTLWRTRPSGGDCVLLARLPVRPPKPRPVVSDQELGPAPDRETERDGITGLTVRPDPVARPEPIQFD